MRRSSVMLETQTTSFIQRHSLQNSGHFLLQKSEVPLSCKTTFQDERINQLIVQNGKPHIDTKARCTHPCFKRAVPQRRRRGTGNIKCRCTHPCVKRAVRRTVRILPPSEMDVYRRKRVISSYFI